MHTKSTTKPIGTSTEGKNILYHKILDNQWIQKTTTKPISTSSESKHILYHKIHEYKNHNKTNRHLIGR